MVIFFWKVNVWLYMKPYVGGSSGTTVERQSYNYLALISLNILLPSLQYISSLWLEETCIHEALKAGNLPFSDVCWAVRSCSCPLGPVIRRNLVEASLQNTGLLICCEKSALVSHVANEHDGGAERSVESETDRSLVIHRFKLKLW